MVRGYPLMVLIILLLSAVFCVGFAEQANAQQKRDPFINGIASFIIPGAGQFLNGERDKALTHFVVGIALSVGYIICPPYIYPVCVTAVFVARMGWGAYSAVDAYDSALRLNEEQGLSFYLDRNNEVELRYSYRF